MCRAEFSQKPAAHAKEQSCKRPLPLNGFPQFEMHELIEYPFLGRPFVRAAGKTFHRNQPPGSLRPNC
jgi:hypothetical protein